MYYSFVLVGLVFLVNGYADSMKDRYYLDLILRELWQYPILRQTLRRLCRNGLDKCKNDQILRIYTNIIQDDHLKKRLDYLIDCFVQPETCFLNNDWQQWSEWSSCSVTCGRGRNVRTRSCKPDRQCLTGSYSTESEDCFASPCPSDHSEHYNLWKNTVIAHPVDRQSIEINFNLIFIFLFPFFFTLICLPLCVSYYFYELDFKIHALTMHISSLCETSKRRRRRRRRINISR